MNNSNSDLLSLSQTHAELLNPQLSVARTRLRLEQRNRLERVLRALVHGWKIMNSDTHAERLQNADFPSTFTFHVS